MNKNILARNLILHSQISEIAEEFAKSSIPVVLLKGIALVEIFAEYAGVRVMDDIDILLRPKDIAIAREKLFSMGYISVEEDPWAMRHPAKPASIDLSDSLWYMSRKENEMLLNECLSYPLQGIAPNAYHLPPDEFYLHVLAHAAIHHGQYEKSWNEDLKLIEEKWGKEINSGMVKKMKLYGISEAAIYINPAASPKNLRAFLYKWLLLKKEIPQKGHILRFMLLPWNKKISYIFKSLFPGKEFMRCRYNLKTTLKLLLYSALRPFLLLIKFSCFITNSIKTR